MVAGKKDTTRSMCRKGFTEISGGDHMVYEYMFDGDPVSRTKVSHGGGKDLSNDLISDMAKECHLSRKQFIAFAKCEMSAEAYRQILIDKGIIPGP
jgi:hypothetical protein